MALKEITKNREKISASCKEVDITVPSLSDNEYVALIKEHYISLASKVVYGRDNKIIDHRDFQTLEELIKASAPLRKLEEFAQSIGIYKSLGCLLPFEKDDIDACFQNYETDIMPEMEKEQMYYFYNRNRIAFELITENWNDEQKRLFSEGYLPEFRKFIHKDIGKFEDILDYGDFQPRGYEVTDNPKGNLVFKLEKDGLQQPVCFRCELEPNKPKKFKEVGYYGYDESFDTYRLKSVSVSGPLNVSWKELLNVQDRRDIYDFMQNAVKNIGVIHIKPIEENAINKLFPGTKRTVLSSIEHQKKKKNSHKL